MQQIDDIIVGLEQINLQDTDIWRQQFDEIIQRLSMTGKSLHDSFEMFKTLSANNIDFYKLLKKNMTEYTDMATDFFNKIVDFSPYLQSDSVIQARIIMATVEINLTTMTRNIKEYELRNQAKAKDELSDIILYLM